MPYDEYRFHKAELNAQVGAEDTTLFLKELRGVSYSLKVMQSKLEYIETRAREAQEALAVAKEQMKWANYQCGWNKPRIVSQKSRYAEIVANVAKSEANLATARRLCKPEGGKKRHASGITKLDAEVRRLLRK